MISMEKRRAGQGGRGKPEGSRRTKTGDKGRSDRSERPQGRGKPEGKPWEERKPRRDGDEKPERRGKPGGKPWGERKPRREGDEKPEKRTDRPDRKSRPEGKPWEERKTKSDSGRPERRGKPGFKPWEERKPHRDRDEKPERKSRPEGKPWEERKPHRAGDEKPERKTRPEGKPWEERKPHRAGDEKPERKSRPEGNPLEERKPHKAGDEKPERRSRPAEKPWEEKRQQRESLETSGKRRKRIEGKPRGEKYQEDERPKSYRKSAVKEELIRLNKYIANSGVCSRREADKLIEAGVVRVNGKVVTELGTKVSPGDKIQYEEQTISKERTKYVLLNKPKGYITTVDDPEKRKTVMSLIEGACKERVYPVGRLDRNTTGLLLFTNDGAITKKLTHPRYGVKKIYHVELDRTLSKADLDTIRKGFELEDGMVEVDKIEYSEDSKSKKELGIELHSGKNRVVRRIFEHFEYKVVKLDRVYYAGLTKKNLPRGHWRLLDEHEINLLKMISS